jgi:hypothetical protein
MKYSQTRGKGQSSNASKVQDYAAKDQPCWFDLFCSWPVLKGGQQMVLSFLT